MVQQRVKINPKKIHSFFFVCFLIDNEKIVFFLLLILFQHFFCVSFGAKKIKKAKKFFKGTFLSIFLELSAGFYGSSRYEVFLIIHKLINYYLRTKYFFPLS